MIQMLFVPERLEIKTRRLPSGVKVPPQFPSVLLMRACGLLPSASIIQTFTVVPTIAPYTIFPLGLHRTNPSNLSEPDVTLRAESVSFVGATQRLELVWVKSVTIEAESAVMLSPL